MDRSSSKVPGSDVLLWQAMSRAVSLGSDAYGCVDHYERGDLMMKRARTKCFLALACALLVFGTGTAVIYASAASAKETPDTVEAKQPAAESGSGSVSIGWGEDEVGDISASEITEAEDLSMEKVEDLSITIRVHPMTGEVITKEEAEAMR